MEDATASSSTPLIHTDELHEDEKAKNSNSDLIKTQLNDNFQNVDDLRDEAILPGDLAIPASLTKQLEMLRDVKSPPEIQQDEESASDLQSVFNKITESLKTIIQDPSPSEDLEDSEVDIMDDMPINIIENSTVSANQQKTNETCVNMSGPGATVSSGKEKEHPVVLELEEISIPIVIRKIFPEPVEPVSESREKVVDSQQDTDDSSSEISNLVIDEPMDSQDASEVFVAQLTTESLSNIVTLLEDTSSNQEIEPVKNGTDNEEISKAILSDSERSLMEYHDDDNDVIAIEEPTTIIDLDDDEYNQDDSHADKMIIDENTVDNSTEKPTTTTTIADEPEMHKELAPSEYDKYIHTGKECINNVCNQNCKRFFKAPMFALSFYKVCVKLNKNQFVCEDCYDASLNKYEEWCRIIDDKQPLLLSQIPENKNEFVEILDSSDEEEGQAITSNTVTGDFPENAVDLLQNELDNIICDVLGRVQIQNQLTWSKNILENRIQKLKVDSDYITDTLAELQRNSDLMNNTLYQCPKIEMKILAPLDLNTGKAYILGDTQQQTEYTIPPLGEIIRPKIELKGSYFAAKNKVMASWLPCKVTEIIEATSQIKNSQFYKIKFMKTKVPILKCVPAKHMAYNDAPTVQLAIGTRVIALFDATTLSKGKDKISEIKSAFYPGIIAEALQAYNNFRYLIFFDDGYTQYVPHRDVRLICEASSNVWEDIHPGSREFIQNYLINYKKNRPMVQVKKGQSMITELNGKWIYAKVIDADASLINMLFEGQKNHTEWIYRGSTRLGPLFKAIQKTNIPAVTRLPRRSEPYVRYMQDDDDALTRETATKSTTTLSIPEEPLQVPVRAVAKKSTSKIQEIQAAQPGSAPVKHLNNSTIFVDDEEPKGKLVYYSAKIDSNPPPKLFVPHKCSILCITRKMSVGHNYGILSKPLLNGWERAIYKLKQKKSAVTYTAPCGRRIRNMEELHKYLRITKNALNVENFVFDPECGCLTEYQVQRCIVNKADITEGREEMPIQCVNYYDHTMPPACIYSADRIPTEGVNINTDLEYLVGCDCEDDCSDKSKCSCWQLTLEGAKYGNAHTPIENVGYYYKRLPEPVPTGIYECNSRCKCSKQCINRVVQHPLDTKLQVFKTSNRGWGLRCINDVPKGSFICIYAGDLLTEQNANEGGANSGDEYFAELDYIEVAERLKEGYESDAQENSNSEDEDQYIPENDSDEEFRMPSKAIDKNVSINTRYRGKKSVRVDGNDDEDEQERQAINFEPNTSLANDDEENSTTKYQSMRKLFGKNEYCYIMDAKNIGNVGRYFNHSCSPNLFVQNVFVDTHDLRFPWVAFFALSQIRAGTELTWNYNYEVGVVPGKVLYCECGAPNCRGRLL